MRKGASVGAEDCGKVAMRCVVILLQADGFCVYSALATRLHAPFARNFTLPKTHCRLHCRTRNDSFRTVDMALKLEKKHWHGYARVHDPIADCSTHVHTSASV